MLLLPLSFSDVIHIKQHPQVLFSTENDLLVFSMLILCFDGITVTLLA